MASKKQAKKSTKDSSKRKTADSSAAASSSRGAKSPSKKKVTTAKKTVKKPTSKPAEKEVSASRSTKKTATGKKVTTKKSPSKRATAQAPPADAPAEVSQSVVSEPTSVADAQPDKKKRSRKTVKKQPQTVETEKKPEEGVAPGVRQLSQAITPGSKATHSLTSTSQEVHTRAANSGALPSTDVKKPRAKKLSKREMERYRQLLLDKRTGLLRVVDHMSTDLLGEKGGGNLSHTPQHMADQGTDNYEQELNLGLVEFEKRLLAEIEDALRRIEDGTYGICQMTGEPISPARLQAKPWAKYSIEAARQLEQAGRR